MSAFTVDEGLAVLIEAWKIEHPGAVVYTIGDTSHSADPNKSQHARDWGRSGRPGDTAGEVDAGDFMPGKGVTDQDLDDLAEDLRLSRDPRIRYVIRRQKIFEATGPDAWEWVKHDGDYHGHTHVSINDNFAANRSPWYLKGLPMPFTDDDKKWLTDTINAAVEKRVGDVVPRWKDNGDAVAAGDPNPAMTAANALSYIGRGLARVEQALNAPKTK